MKTILRNAVLASVLGLNLLAAAPAAKANATYGPSLHTDRVLAFSTDTYVIRFNGGEDAVIGVSGDRDTDLDLFVYDENGHLITSDTDLSDQCVVRFRPLWTGNFIVKVVNRGPVSNVYQIGVR